jgi:hypothetical protein
MKRGRGEEEIRVKVRCSALLFSFSPLLLFRKLP